MVDKKERVTERKVMTNRKGEDEIENRCKENVIVEVLKVF